MKNKKGFTLIELLAVIVILAILLAVAIPQVTKYITNSRKDSYVTTAKDFADAVRKDATGELYDLPIASNDVTIISINMVELEKGGTKSPFNGKWVNDSSYVAIVNTGTDIDPNYKYYVTLTDSKRYTIALTRDDRVNTDSIVRNSASKEKVKVTPICGEKDGTYKIIGNIAGLEEFRQPNGWNATVYSADGC